MQKRISLKQVKQKCIKTYLLKKKTKKRIYNYHDQYILNKKKQNIQHKQASVMGFIRIFKTNKQSSKNSKNCKRAGKTSKLRLCAKENKIDATRAPETNITKLAINNQKDHKNTHTHEIQNGVVDLLGEKKS